MLTRIKANLATHIEKICSLSSPEIENLLEVPKQFDHGHLAWPVFTLAKTMRKAPPLIAKELAEKIDGMELDFLAAVTPVNGFINFTFTNLFLQSSLSEALSEGSDKLGYSRKKSGKKLVIDYSSPNVAKPMSIGHLRATVVGQAIRNLAETQGFEVVGVNHLGDWGVQFGKLAWAFQNWGHEYPFEEEPFDSLFKLYVRFHKEADENPELDKLGSETFNRLENGDEEIKKLWQKFLDISIEDYQRLYDRMGVKHDLIRGESFYIDLMKPVEKKLEDLGLLEESEGAMVVKLDDEDMPPCLIRKGDGASLYATRDLACAIHRREEMGADLNLYVVGMDQNLHFKQVFSVLKKMGYDWTETCEHISFGMYRFKDGKMSTRKGNIMFLEDVLNRAVELMAEIIEEKNPTLENKERVAEQVGIGAVIFNDLVNDRVRNIDFDWERVLDFEGASGPYVQYCQVRCNSLMNKYDGEISPQFSSELKEKEERELIYWLLQYEPTLTAAFAIYRPNILAQYLLEVCRSFNHFYQKHRILGEAKEVEASRMTLVYSTREVLRAGLKVLSIESPEAM